MSFYYNRDMGLTFARAAVAVAAGKGSAAGAVTFAETTYGRRSETADIVRAIAGGITPGSPGWGSELAEGYANAAREFWGYTRARTVIGRLGLRAVPFHAPLLTATGGTTADWVPENGLIPLTDMDFAAGRMETAKVGGICIFSADLARLGHAETLVRDDLARAIAARIDETFLSAAAGVPGERPDGIGHNAITVPASGDMAADLARLVEAFPGDSTRAAFIGAPALFAGLSSPAYPALGLSDGELLNRPALASGNIPADGSPQVYDLYMLAPDDIALAEGTMALEGSNQATVILEGGEKYSLWQQNLLGVRGVQPVNWRAPRDAVAILTGITVGGDA